MALPVLDKSYTHNTNQQTGSLGSAGNEAKTTLLAIKADMIAAATTPWTVSGSSNASVSSMDGTDRWSVIGDLTNSLAAHSWIVLRQTGINAKFEVCFDLNDPDSAFREMSIIVSPSAGFGTVNGGTDGTTSARPTATDEDVILDAVSGADWLDSSTASRSIRTNTQVSTDGSVTRIWCYVNNICKMSIGFFKPKNPVAAWTTPSWYYHIMNVSFEVLSFSNFSDADGIDLEVTGSTGAGRLCSIGYGAQMLGENDQFANEVTGDWDFSPMWVRSSIATKRGVIGAAFDQWWGSVTNSSGDNFPGDATKTFIQVSDMIFPWDGSTPITA